MSTHTTHDTKKAPGIIYLHPLMVRIWHWINALGIVTLCLTGIQIRFPDTVNLFGSYNGAINLHNTAGIVVCVAWLVWFWYYAVSLGMLIMLYVPTKKDLKFGLLRQGRFYMWEFFKGGPNPHHITPFNKFNPLQKMAYFGIMFFLLPAVCITGILLLNISPLREYVLLVGGLKILDAVHFLIGAAFAAFVIAHLYLATLGHTPFAHFIPMWTGWEELEDHEH